MREIKFRGKRLDNGEWLYGNLVELRNPFNHEDSPACFIMPKEVNIADPDSIAEQEVVDPATVGQFTGLHDKNGNEIYEGDIIEISYNYPGLSFKGIATYKLARFIIRQINGDGYTLFSDYRKEQFEVIGNIHENPELLKP